MSSSSLSTSKGLIFFLTTSKRSHKCHLLVHHHQKYLFSFQAFIFLIFFLTTSKRSHKCHLLVHHHQKYLFSLPMKALLLLLLILISLALFMDYISNFDTLVLSLQLFCLFFIHQPMRIQVEACYFLLPLLQRDYLFYDLSL